MSGQAANEEYVIGDLGTQFRVTLTVRNATTNALTPLDLTTFTTIEMQFKKTNGDVITKPATVVAPATNGQIEYLSETDLAVEGEHGTWARRGRVSKVGSIVTGVNWIEFLVIDATKGVAVANLERIKRHIPTLDNSDVSQDTILEDYWKDIKHYYDNKRSLFTTVPLKNYESDVIDLFEKGAAAWWIHWNSPDHQLDTVKEIKKEIVETLKAQFVKRHEDISGRTATPKTPSRVTGFTN